MLKDTVISVLKGVAHWYDGRGWLYTRHVPAEGEDPLAGINDYVSTMASAHIITVVRSVRVSRNIFVFYILWLGGR